MMRGVVGDALGHQFGVLHVVGGVGDDAGDEALAFGQLGGLPDLPLVGVTGDWRPLCSRLQR